MARRSWEAAAQTIVALASLTGEWVDCRGATGLTWIANYICSASDAVVALEVSFDGGTTAIVANTVTPASTSSAGFHVRRTWTNDFAGESPSVLTDVVVPGVPGPLARLKVTAASVNVTSGNFCVIAMGGRKIGDV